MTETTGTKASGWVGWGWFAGFLLIAAGVFDALYGLTALFAPDSVYFAVNGTLFLFDLQGWAWWHLLTGLALILVAIFLLRGATWARVVAIILVLLNAIGQLYLLPAQPWWSLIVITLDIFIVYALTVHGRELKSAA
ncbi:hypothetical protein ACGGZK_00840 [Agromyces sp. MMS24-K17]|uniref:DUF7144 family membrane protein n=1 Tax=Agromyces sp. MMS24-K17 TaxID=3372850 RepID=UPI0037552368